MFKTTHPGAPKKHHVPGRPGFFNSRQPGLGHKSACLTKHGFDHQKIGPGPSKTINKNVKIGGFPKQGYHIPKSWDFSWDFQGILHCKPTILSTPMYGNPQLQYQHERLGIELVLRKREEQSLGPSTM